MLELVVVKLMSLIGSCKRKRKQANTTILAITRPPYKLDTPPPLPQLRLPPSTPRIP